MEMTNTLNPPTPSPPSARFTLELEFVLSLSNPYYLSHLASAYPHLLNPPTSDSTSSSTTGPDSDASRFAAYLAYLYAYWRTPQYSKYLSHPGAVLRSLELLQQERFRKDIIRPDVIARLLEDGTNEIDGQGTDKGEQEGKDDEAVVVEGRNGEKPEEMDITED
jgi:mediator of RNA polymerase II transcription subunit 31